MRLTVLGCSGSVPSAESPASGYLVESGNTRIVLDLGNGTLSALQRFVDPFELDGVLLTHLHPDHCADIAALTVLRRYHPSPPRMRLPVLAPEEAPERLAALYAPSAAERTETDLSDVYAFEGLPEAPVELGDFVVRAVQLVHVTPSWGIRVSAEGRTLAYTGDTGPCGALSSLARDADVVLSEAAWADFPRAPTDVHLSGKQAGQAAREAGAHRLLLTHVQPWSDRHAIFREGRTHFGGPVELVEAGRTYTI